MDSFDTIGFSQGYQIVFFESINDLKDVKLHLKGSFKRCKFQKLILFILVRVKKGKLKWLTNKMKAIL
jgi:hypothetical protein